MRARRAAGPACWLVLGVGVLTGCAQIVGIGDTAVTLDGGSDGPIVGEGDGASDSSASSSADATLEVGAGPDGGGPDGAGPDGASPDGTTRVQEGGLGGFCVGDAGTNCRGPTMVTIPTTPPYYIDSTEVTVAQYAAFLTAKGSDTSGQPAECAWNTAFTTGAASNPDDFPVTNVDWCDALAFCTWAGKHLCGKIGGGAVPSADALDQAQSQWFLACGGPQGNDEPNGNAVCNSSDGCGGLAPVATFPGCQGFYSNLWDLAGNAAEWIDSCDPGDGGPQTDPCYLAGGNYIDETSYCSEDYSYARNDLAPTFGFRCCAE